MSWLSVPIGQFADFHSEWQKMCQMVGAPPLLDSAFIGPLIEQFATGREHIFVHQGNPAAIGILSRLSPLHWQSFQPANAPLGSWMMEPACDFASVLRSLRDALPRTAILIGLSQLDPAIFPRPVGSKTLSTIDYIQTARIDIAGNYEDYWASRSKNLRRNMVRQRNRLDRENRVVRLENLTEPAHMAAAVADYARLESAGWKAAVASSVHIDNPQGRFYAKMLAKFASNGEARVLRYFYDDKLVACDLCLFRNKVLYILKTTHDESEKSTSPAHLMRHEVIRTAFDIGDIARIEFYGPAQDWHMRWTDDARVMYHLNYYALPCLAHLHSLARTLG